MKAKYSKAWGQNASATSCLFYILNIFILKRRNQKKWSGVFKKLFKKDKTKESRKNEIKTGKH